VDEHERRGVDDVHVHGSRARRRWQSRRGVDGRDRNDACERLTAATATASAATGAPTASAATSAAGSTTATSARSTTAAAGAAASARSTTAAAGAAASARSTTAAAGAAATSAGFATAGASTCSASDPTSAAGSATAAARTAVAARSAELGVASHADPQNSDRVGPPRRPPRHVLAGRASRPRWSGCALRPRGQRRPIRRPRTRPAVGRARQ
jgi:hypothetical protein